MEIQLSLSSKSVAKPAKNVKKIRKALNMLAMDEMETLLPLNVTYVSNKKAKIVKYIPEDTSSTDDEES